MVVGDNGQGKTNLAEAIAYLATLSSFRGAPNDALVRVGAVLGDRPGVAARREQSSLIEAEVLATGRGRVQVNRQRLARSAICWAWCA